MATPARPPGRHPPNPSLSPTSRPAAPPSPTTPAARRPHTPRRATQDTPWAACVDGSRNSAPSQCKQDPRSNQMRHANAATSRTKGIGEPDYSDKLKVSRFSGGTYSKPEARVKLIPVEDITYAKHKKPYVVRTVGTAVLQKRHCRRSVTPPPNSRKVSIVGSRSPTQSPKTSASSYDSCLPCKRPATAENWHPFARGHISSSVTPKITSLRDPASPSCKSSQPLSTNWNTDATPRNVDRMDGTKALARSSSSSILHSQGQSSQQMSASLPKGAMVNPVSPSPKQMRALHPSGDPACTKAGSSSKSLCTPESAKLCSRNINSITRSTAAPGVQAPMVETALLSPTSVLSERPIEVYPDTRASAPVVQEPIKSLLSSPIPVHHESSTECDNTLPIHSPQSMASAQHSALLQEKNSEASINCSRSLAFCHNVGTPEILHMKLHKKHNQPEALWKGNFRVIGELIHTCDGLEAHFPLVISVKVYEAAKNMPEILNLEAIPLSQLWPKQFKMEPPDGEDIGLWFASSHERPHRSFDHLLEKVASHTGLLTKVGDTELAIFSSLLLAPHYQRKNGELYFWGVFGKRIRKKQCQPSSHITNVKINPSQSNEDSCNKYEKVGARLNVTKGKGTEDNESDIGMTLDARGNPTDVTENRERVRDNYEGIAKELDLTGGKETDRVNDCMAVAVTPDSNPASSCSAPAASLLNRCCSHDSANNKSTFGLEGSACRPADRSSASSDLMLDIPPGFSLDVPPGFAEAHRQLPIEAAAVSRADAPPSLILDTPPGFPSDIPPGFTEAHRQPPAAISSAGPATRASTPLLNGCCSRDSANNKSTSSLEDSACQPADRSSASSDLMLDIPPGFPLDVPPGFTKAHRQLPIEAAAVSRADAPPSLILDTPPGFPSDIPPGFTEAQRRPPAAISSAGPAARASTPGTEKKPLIRFSLNVTRPVKLQVPPGFTALHKVKKEPVLPAVNKATEKQTLYSFAPAAFSIGKAGKADEMEIMDNEVKVERDNSEEREFPKIRRLSDLYRGPSDITESPEPAFLPEKFREQVPEKQMHPGKRVRPESPEPSADITTGRPNVNGRIALSNIADQGSGKVRCICASSGGRAVLPTRASGDHLDSESISCRCVVCGEEFPSQ